MITQLYISVGISFYLLLTIRIFGIRGNPIFWWLSYGKENEETVNRVVRGHANFVEYAPLFFIMLFILEYVETLRNSSCLIITFHLKNVTAYYFHFSPTKWPEDYWNVGIIALFQLPLSTFYAATGLYPVYFKCLTIGL